MTELSFTHYIISLGQVQLVRLKCSSCIVLPRKLDWLQEHIFHKYLLACVAFKKKKPFNWVCSFYFPWLLTKPRQTCDVELFTDMSQRREPQSKSAWIHLTYSCQTMKIGPFGLCFHYVSAGTAYCESKYINASQLPLKRPIAFRNQCLINCHQSMTHENSNERFLCQR